VSTVGGRKSDAARGARGQAGARTQVFRHGRREEGIKERGEDAAAAAATAAAAAAAAGPAAAAVHR
jgi:hypothetical protein